MIVSDLKHIWRQVVGNPLLEKALEFLQGTVGRTLDDGRITVDGDRVYALVQSYETSPAPAGGPLLEAHRKYIDIQYIAEGVEAIGCAPTELLNVSAAYDPAKDVEFGTVPRASLTLVRLAAGQLALLWPEDAHAPKLAAAAGDAPAQPAQVKKIVVKVAV